MWESESDSVGGRDYGNSATAGALSTLKPDLKTDGFEQRGQAWFVATDIPSDFLVQIGDVDFHLHKYPLISRCGKLNRLIYESINSEDLNRVILDDIPGGPESFELAAKFCYGIAVDLTASNISGLRCASEYLEMTEDLEEGNLIFKTEAFLSYVVLSSWRDSIVVLKSCEKLSPWAENLQIVRRCSESIAWKACANPKGIRWAYTGRPPKPSSSSSPRWNNSNNDQIKDNSSSSPGRGGYQVPPDWWFEDVSLLRIDHFVRVITAIKVKGMRSELIGASITHYASKWLPGLITKDNSTTHHHHHHFGGTPAAAPPPMKADEASGSWKGGGLHMIIVGSGTNNKDESNVVQARDQRMIIESLVSIIPPLKDSVSCSFLLRLLRMANMLKVAPALVTELEKRVGMQFEQASLPDLLIPCYNTGCGKGEGTMYDVDLVQRLLEHFLVQEQTAECASPSRDSFSDKPTVLHDHQRGSGGAPAFGGGGGGGGGVSSSKIRVARLLDSYLTEVAKDRNLSLTKFQVLAEALPESARTCDDGLYRAIDSYLKAHPTLSEHERKRLCRIMDCQKLSMDACMHAAQNERLPLRVVVQVLFSEQVKISNAIANNTLKDPSLAAALAADQSQPAHQSSFTAMIPNRRTLLDGAPQSFQDGWAGAKKDINTLKFELETVKTKYIELQGEFEGLQRQFEKMAKQSSSGSNNNKGGGGGSSSSAWASGWKKLSKLTKMNHFEGQDVGSQVPVDQSRKTPRRWRNSIS